MSEPQIVSPRRRARWIVLGVIGLILLSAGGVFLDAWIAAAKLLEREEEGVRRRSEELRNFKVVRPTLFEPAEEGNAWDSIEKANVAIRAIPMEEQDVLFPTLSGEEFPTFDDRAIARLLPGVDPAMEHLERALRLRDWEPGRNYDDLFGSWPPESGATTRLSRSLNDLAIHKHRLSRFQESLELLAKALWIVEWSTAKGTWQEERTVWILNGLHRNTLRDILRLHEATSSTLAWFAGVMDRIEEAHPPSVELLRREDLAIRQVYLRVAREGMMPRCVYKLQDTGWPVHRGLLPLRLQVARWLNQHESVFQNQVRLATLDPWLRTHLGRCESRSKSENLFEVLSGPLRHAWCGWLSNRRGSALARVAVAVAWFESERGSYPQSMSELVPRYLKAVPIDFTNGKPLCYSNRGESAVVYALGRDGDDDDGRAVMEDDSDEDGDIVWTVKRREAAAK